MGDLPQQEKSAEQRRAPLTDSGAGPRQRAHPLSPAELDLSLRQALEGWDASQDLWLFAYGSLVWNPGIAYREQRLGSVHGYHRRLCLWSRINRGTPQCPGLVLALDRGGCCRGLAYRIARAEVAGELRRLWKREMVFGSYRPTWLMFRAADTAFRALGFVIDRRSPGYTGRLSDEALLQAVRTGEGRYGSCVDYVCRTADALAAHGIVDPELTRLKNMIAGEKIRSANFST